MKQPKTRYCRTCKETKIETKEYFYWDSFYVRFETQCKKCRRKKHALQKRRVYDSKKERERYLRRKATGEFTDKWKKWRDKYPEKYQARYTLRNAIKMGKIKPANCEIGVDCTGRMEAHHPDYSKPLEVRWLCQKHHKIGHHKY